MQSVADGLFWNRGSVVERLKSISDQAAVRLRKWKISIPIYRSRQGGKPFPLDRD